MVFWSQIRLISTSNLQDNLENLSACFRFELLSLWKMSSLHNFSSYNLGLLPLIPLWGVWLSLVLHFSLGRIIIQHHILHGWPITLVSNSSAEISKGTCSNSSHCFHSSESQRVFFFSLSFHAYLLPNWLLGSVSFQFQHEVPMKTGETSG